MGATFNQSIQDPLGAAQLEQGPEAQAVGQTTAQPQSQQPINELAGAFPPQGPALQPGGNGIPNEQLLGLGQEALAPSIPGDVGQLAGVL